MKEERFSSGTPSKNKIATLGYFSFIPKFYIPLSLSLSLSLSQFEEKQKSRKDIYIRGLSIHCIFDTLKVYLFV